MIYATEPVDAANHARRLKTLKCLTPVQFIWMEWQAKPDLFYEEPYHLTVGPYSLERIASDPVHRIKGDTQHDQRLACLGSPSI